MRTRPDPFALCALGLLACTASVRSQTDFVYPDTKAGRIAEACIAAINAGDEATVRKFIKTHRAASSLEKRSVDERTPKFVQMNRMLGELAPGHIVESEALTIELLARSSNMSAWFSFRFGLETTPPHKLLHLTIQPGDDPTKLRQGYTDWKDLTDLLRQVAEDYKIPGIVAAVADAESIRASAAVGVRRMGEPDAVRLGDRFHIGSVTKSMTATVLGTLVERGQLSLDLTLGEALPDVEMAEGYRAATLRQVLHHRAGLPSVLDPGDDDDRRWKNRDGSERDRRAAFLADILRREPASTPGEKFAYSNAGYVLAGHVAERVARTTWEELMRRELFAPLRMHSAGFGWPTRVAPGQPFGHEGTMNDMRPQEEDYELGDYMAPAGDVSCSVEDLTRFGQLHLRGMKGQDGVLASKTIQLLHETAPMGGGQAYAAGWMVDMNEAEPDHEHGGSAGTFFAMLVVSPSRDRVVTVMMNSGALSNMAIVEKIATAIRERGL